MRFFELVRFAMGAIVAHPMRSVLTSLGVVIGVAAVMMMTSIGVGASQKVSGAIGALGSNLIIVSPNYQRPGQVSQGAGQGLSLKDADAQAITKQVDGIAAVAPVVRGQVQLSADGANWSTGIQGVTPDYLVARDLNIASGRMFDDREARQGRKVLVIGPTVARELWGDADPVGRRVRVKNVPFEVIGVLEAKGQSGFGQDQDDVAIGPLSAVRSRIIGRRIRADTVQTIFVKATNASELDRVQEDVANLVRDQHHIKPGEDDDFQTQNMASILAASQSAIGVFTVLLAAVAGVSLVVGGVGIMNIMLVAVTERTREIGLRMAIGAREAHIRLQFLGESVLLSLIGGSAGIIAGIVGAKLLGGAKQWQTEVSTDAIVMANLFALLVGVLFGFYPAYRAARLDPIEALRQE